METPKRAAVCFLLLSFSLAVSGCQYFAKTRRLSYVRKHPELSETQKDLLIRGKLWTGMNKKEVRACLGNPSTVRIGILGKKEVWTYIYKNQYTPHRKYMFERALRLEFLSGRLADWRED